MKEKTKQFFIDRGFTAKDDLNTLEIIRKEWAIDYIISASARNVKVEIPFYGWAFYGDSADEAIKTAINKIVEELRPK